MNPMILKTASLLNDCKTVHNKNHAKLKGKGDFLSNILAALSRGQTKSLHGQDKTARTGLPMEKKGYKFILESFRKGLLAKGKPLDKISLNKEDLPLLKKLLLQCGFSEQKVERFLKELKDGTPGGEINLGNFFQKVAKLGPPERSKENDAKNYVIEPSAIPHIESVLRNFGLTPKELDNVISAAKVEGGGLDLKRFAIKLKEISNRISDKVCEIKDYDKAKQISNKMEMIGLNLPDKAKAGRISIKDFITSLEQVTKRSGKENSPPPELKSTMDRLLERAIISGEKQKFVSFSQADANLKLHDHVVKGKINDRDKSLDNESLLPNLNEKSDKINNIGRQDIENSHHAKKVELFSNLSGGKGFQNKPGKEGHGVKAEIRIMETSQQNTVSNFAETINAVEANDKAFRGSLPAYLVDQIGKQISKSILRGDRIVRLQLKPPDLGRVKIKIDIKDNALKLGIIAEHSSVKELLLSNIHELRGALVSQGIKLENIDIQINYGFNQSLADSKEWMNKGKKWNQDSRGGSFMSKNNTEGLQSVSPGMVTENSLVDLVA